MKKVLLGTTALIAASVVAGGVAQAAEEPISVGLGGYYRAAMAFISQDDSDGQLADNDHSNALAQDIEIAVTGSTTLDNGITVGFNAMIEGNTVSASESSALDERFIFFRGSFGMARIGATESARQEMTNFAPNGAWNFGVNTPFFQFPNPGNASGIFNVRTYNDGLGNEDSIKLLYFTPTFNGARLAVSYAPDDDEFGQYGQNVKDVVGELQNQWSVSGEFAHDFGDFNVRVATGYEGYTVERCGATAGITCNSDPASLHVGGTISFSGVSIGGGWLDGDQVAHNATGGEMEREDFDIGVSYWTSQYGVGLLYGSADIDMTDNTTDELDIFALNGTYILGPGIDVEAQVDFGEYDDATAGGLDNDWTNLMIGTALNF